MPSQQKIIPTQKPEYKYIGKESLSEIIARIFPKQLIPTKRMSAIFGGIFVLALVLAIFNFPLDSLISGKTNISIGIGYPYPFLDLGPASTEKFPLKIFSLVIDMILYLILAYIIDIALNFILKNFFTTSKEEIEKRPKLFKDQKPKNTAETITKKIFKKTKSTTNQQHTPPSSPPHLSQQS